MTRMLLWVAILVFFAGAARAQFGVGVSVEQLYDDNVDNSAYQTADHVTAGSLLGSYDVEGERSAGRLSYEGTMRYFGRSPDRSYLYHSVHLEYTHAFDDSESASFYSGLSMSRRAGRDLFTIYDHNQWSGYLNGRHLITDWWLGKGGYTFRMFTFHEMPGLNYIEHRGFLQSALSLAEGTTVIMEANLGTKQYTDPIVTSDSLRLPSIEGLSDRVIQGSGVLRLGQSISDGLGLSVTGQYLMNFTRADRFFVSGDVLLSAEEVFDDHYSYDGPQFEVAMTWVSGSGIVAVLAAGLQDKSFPGRPVLSMEGTPLDGERHDVRWNASVEISTGEIVPGIAAEASYEYIHNASNDMLFEYVNNVLSLALRYVY